MIHCLHRNSRSKRSPPAPVQIVMVLIDVFDSSLFMSRKALPDDTRGAARRKLTYEDTPEQVNLIVVHLDCLLSVSFMILSL